MNTIGVNCKQYRNVHIEESSIGDDCVIGDDAFVRNSVLGKRVRIERRSMLFHTSIDDYSYCMYNTVIKHASIGRYCSISWNCSIGGANHEIHRITQHPFPHSAIFGFTEDDNGFISFEKPLTIGNDVWIAANCCICRGVKIGNGAIIGAGSVVTHDVPSFEIWAGVPARKIGQRFSNEIAEIIEQAEWWNLSEGTIRKYISSFRAEATNPVLLTELFEEMQAEESKNNG